MNRLGGETVAGCNRLRKCCSSEEAETGSEQKDRRENARGEENGAERHRC